MPLFSDPLRNVVQGLVEGLRTRQCGTRADRAMPGERAEERLRDAIKQAQSKLDGDTKTPVEQAEAERKADKHAMLQPVERFMRLSALALLVPLLAQAQTKLDLGNQGKNADFSGYATLTRPWRTGSALPGTCTAGEVFWRTSNTTLYICTSTNTWTAQGATAVWGSITGTLTDQSDLASALGVKVNWTQSSSNPSDPCPDGGSAISLHSNSSADTYFGCNGTNTWSRFLTDLETDIMRVGQSNTISTATQSFAAATAFLPKVAAAYAPTTAAHFGYNSTSNRFVGGNGSTTHTFMIIGDAPTAHTVSHQHGGADEVSIATPTANAIPKANGSNKLAAGWISEVLALADLSNVSAIRGNGTTVQMTTGSVSTDDCAKFDSNGNIVSAGAACGAGGGTPGGSDTQLQYNNSSAFGGTSGLVWNGTRLANTNAPAASATEALFRQGSALVSASADGTYFGVNAAAMYAGDFLNFQVDGVSLFRVAADGSVQSGNGTDPGYWDFLEGTISDDPDSGFRRVFVNGSGIISTRSDAGTVVTYATTGGNIATATSLAINGSNCSSGQAARGVDASGAAEDCFTPGGGGAWKWAWPSLGGWANSQRLWYVNLSSTATLTDGGENNPPNVNLPNSAGSPKEYFILRAPLTPEWVDNASFTLFVQIYVSETNTVTLDVEHRCLVSGSADPSWQTAQQITASATSSVYTFISGTITNACDDNNILELRVSRNTSDANTSSVAAISAWAHQ